MPQNSGTAVVEIRGQTGEFPISSTNYPFENREFTRLTPNFCRLSPNFEVKAQCYNGPGTYR